MSRSYKDQDGQAIVLMAIALTVLMGMAALVLDVGLWMRSDRRLQQTADAAALAGAQKLPTDPAGAKALALSYANQNGGDVLAADIVVSTTYTSNDTISVDAAKNEPGIFSKVLGINSARVEASAKARTDSPQQARYVAPMVVYCDHPLIQNCNGGHTPTFNVHTHDGLRQDGRAGRIRDAQPRRRQRHSRRQARRATGSFTASTSTCRSACTAPIRARSSAPRTSAARSMPVSAPFCCSRSSRP